MTATVQQEVRLIPLDPKDRSTWKNIPSPVDLSAIQQELTRVGGTQPDGRPDFMIVWAQEYRSWDAGAMRIHFDEEAVPGIHTPHRFAVPPDVYARCLTYLQGEHERRKRAYMNLDWVEFNRYPDVSIYLKENELSANYLALPSEEEDLQRLIASMPAGWMYVNGLHSFEHIGEQCFYVLQFFRREEFGNDKDWNELRFDRAYLPETDQEEELVDILGDFPYNGRYEHVAVRICETRTYEDPHPVIIGQTITREIHGYKEPTFANAVEPVKELLAIRERLTDAEKDPIEINRNRFTEYREQSAAKLAAWRKDFRQRFDAAKPVGKGNPTNISANKTKL